MRISETEYKTPLPAREDLLSDIESIPPIIKKKYIPSEMDVLCQYTLFQLELSDLLRQVPKSFRSAEKIIPSQEEWKESEHAILTFRSRVDAYREQFGQRLCKISILAGCQVDICYASVAPTFTFG